MISFNKFNISKLNVKIFDLNAEVERLKAFVAKEAIAYQDMLDRDAIEIRNLQDENAALKRLLKEAKAPPAPPAPMTPAMIRREEIANAGVYIKAVEPADTVIKQSRRARK